MEQLGDSSRGKHAYCLEKLKTFSKLVASYIHYYKAEKKFSETVLSLEDSLDPMLETTTYLDQLIHVLVGHHVQDNVLQRFLLFGREFVSSSTSRVLQLLQFKGFTSGERGGQVLGRL